MTHSADPSPWSVDDMSEDELIAAARREWCETPPRASQESALADCPPAVVAALLQLADVVGEGISDPNQEYRWKACGACGGVQSPVRQTGGRQWCMDHDEDCALVAAIAAIREALR